MAKKLFPSLFLGLLLGLFCVGDFSMARTAPSASVPKFSRLPGSTELAFADEAEVVAKARSFGYERSMFNWPMRARLMVAANKQLEDLASFFGPGFYPKPKVIVAFDPGGVSVGFYAHNGLQTGAYPHKGPTIQIGIATLSASSSATQEESATMNFAVSMAHEYGHAVFAHYLMQTLGRSASTINRLHTVNEFFADLFAAVYFNNLSVVGRYLTDSSYAFGTIYRTSDFDSQIPDDVVWTNFEVHAVTDPARAVLGYWLKYRLDEKATPAAVLKAVLDASDTFLLAYPDGVSKPFTKEVQNEFVDRADLRAANQLLVDMIIREFVLNDLIDNSWEEE